MRWLAFVMLWWGFSAITPVPQVNGDRVVFGVRIAMSSNSQMTSFVALRYSPDGVLREKRNFTRDDFIRVLSGFWPSSFNPKRINYFEKENVFGGVYVNDTLLQKIPYCPAFDSLWKIRFSDYPFRGGNESGWSGGLYKPTLAQQQYLIDRYHIRHIDQDYFIDSNFWVLLRDVSDSAWIANYRSIK